MKDVARVISDQEIAEVTRWLAATPNGRTVLAVLLYIDCQLDEDTLDARGSAMRSVGLKWLHRVQSEAPHDYLNLVSETINRYRPKAENPE